MKTFSIKPLPTESRKLIKCPLCGSDHFTNYWDCDLFSYVICLDCRLILQNPQPTFKDLDNRYNQEYFKYEQSNDLVFFDLMLKGLADIDFETNPRGFKKKTFLDIGCATGLLVEYMQKNGWISRGVELCSPAAEYGSRTRGVDIFAGTVEQASFDDNTFDTVHCSHLIEHLNDPSAYLDEVYRILKPGGLFICTTPNADGLQARIFKDKWRSAIADHMFLFSRRTLNRLLKNKSFTIEKVKTWGGIGKGYAPEPIKKILDKSAKILNFGDVMIISCRKADFLNKENC